MFHMVNEYGNVHKLVKSEHKRDELIALGYHEVKVPAEEERESPLSPDGDIPPLGKGGVDGTEGDTEDDTQGAATEEGAQAAAGGDNTTEDDAQAVKDPEPAPALEPKPEDKEPKPAKSPKTTGGKSTKGEPKKGKTKKNAAEE